jgi:NADH dehydrogenase
MATVGDPSPHVVIVGGGFGGLYAARALRKARVRLTLLDRRNHHLFQPLLYQVATAALNPSDIAVPIRSILRSQKNATVLLADARSVHLQEKKVILSDGEIAFDALILATGASHSYFGHEDWAAFAPGLKSIEDALRIRRKVLLAFEHAEREKDPQAVREWLTFVIIGAGPTGVELAGAIAENARHALARDFRAIDPTEARVLLLEGAPRVLPPFPPGLSTKAQEALAHLGVEVRPGATVTGVDAGGVFVGAERISARTVLWAAGVAASPLARSLGVPLDRAGRVVVTPELTLPGRSDVFVIGDLALVEQDGRPVPGVATAAIQEGRHAARNVVRAVGGQPLLPFRYHDKGSLATIGRGKAVAAFPGHERSGFFAWCVWLLVHIFFLIGFRNRVMVLLGWAWAYVTWQRGARLITGEDLSSAPEKPRS